MTQLSYKSGLLFSQAYRLVRGNIADSLLAHDLTPTDWTVLGITAHARDGVRLATVAREMDVKAPLITMLANNLIEKELLVSVPHHTDKRVKLLMLTAKGKKLVLQVEAELSITIARLMHGVSEADAAGFERTLTAIVNNARNL